MYSKENSKKDVHETVALRSAILTENWSSTMVEQSEKRGPRADSLREPIYTRKHPIAATRKPATVLMMTWLTSEPLAKVTMFAYFLGVHHIETLKKLKSEEPSQKIGKSTGSFVKEPLKGQEPLNRIL